MNAEQVIKNTLDGWFYAIRGEQQKVQAIRVPTDYLPSHGAPEDFEERDPEEEQVHHNTKKFTPEQDELIIELRAQMKAWRRIGEIVGADQHVAKRRYLYLCEKRGIEPIRLDVNSRKWTEAQIAELVRLRADGWCFEAIGAKVGMTRMQATDLHRRLREDGKLSQYLCKEAA